MLCVVFIYVRCLSMSVLLCISCVNVGMLNIVMVKMMFIMLLFRMVIMLIVSRMFGKVNSMLEMCMMMWFY